MKNFILNFTLLVLGTHLFAQNTWTVDNRPGSTAQFTSVQAAHDAATAGDTIYVHPSIESYGFLNVNRSIHVRGLGHNPEHGKISASLAVQLSLPSNSSFSGLKITAVTTQSVVGSPIFSNVIFQNNSINSMNLFRSNNCIVQGNIFTSGTLALNLSTSTNATIKNNIFNMATNGSFNEAAISSASSTNTIENNVIIYNGTSGNPGIFTNCNNPIVRNNIIVINNATSTDFRIPNSTINFQNCLTFSYGGLTLPAIAGTNNLNNTNPQFETIGTPENPAFAYTKSYKLKGGSPAIGAGLNGEDLGIYGQGFLFQMSGYPFDLPYPTSINITNVLAQTGNTLNVVLKANANPEN